MSNAYLEALDAVEQHRLAIARIQACATDRLEEVQGDVTTYEEAFRKLEIACAALRYIAGVEVYGTKTTKYRMSAEEAHHALTGE